MSRCKADNGLGARPVTIAIFASGEGTNCENIINCFRESTSVRVGIVVCNRPDAPVLERAARLNVRTRLLTKAELAEDERLVLDVLDGCDYIVLAGFLLRIPQYLIDRYPHRIINIHPSLLPKFGGKGMWGENVHRAVKASGETETGITIHYVDEGFDTGKIIAQFKTAIGPDDSVQDIAAKVHQLEMAFFPKVIEEVVGASPDL